MFFDILSKSFQIFLSTPSLLVYPVAAWVISFVATFLLRPILLNQSLFSLIIVGIPMIFLLGILSLMSAVASCYVVFKRLKGEDVSIMDGVNLAIARFRQIASFIGFIFMVLLVAGIISSLILAVPALVFLALILYIGFIIFALSTMLVYVVIAVEGLGGLAAYQRSAQLVNNTKSVVGFIFLFSFIFGFILSLIFAGSITPRDIELIQRTGTYPEILGFFANPLFQFVFSTLTSMFSSIFTAVWYAKAVEKVDRPTP